MSYVISGLSADPFRPLFGLTDAELAARNVLRVTSDAEVGYPCRVRLEDVPPGETLLLLNHEHLPQDTPYRSRHAIFISEAAGEPARFVDEVPPVLSVRKAISIRSFDAAGMMLDADLAAGDEIEPLILRLLANPDAAYLHAHNAGRGCYAARIDRT